MPGIVPFIPLIAAGVGMVAQNGQNKATIKNADNATATANGQVSANTDKAISRIDNLYKTNPNPINSAKPITGPTQIGGGHVGGGIMGGGGQMQPPVAQQPPQPPPQPPQQPPQQPPAGQPGMQGLQQMIAAFMQNQGQPGQGGQGGGMPAFLEQLMQHGKPGGAAPPPQPFNVTPHGPPNGGVGMPPPSPEQQAMRFFHNPRLPLDPRVAMMGDRAQGFGG